MKCQKGITMMELVIVIIIIVLITSFSIYTGNTALDQATATEVYTEINSIREGLNSVNMKRSLSEEGFDIDEYSGQIYDQSVKDISKSEFETLSGLSLTDEEFEGFKNFYIIFGMDKMEQYKNSNVRKYYGFETIKHSYLVDFDDCRVDLLKSVNISSQKVRTFEQIRALVDEGEI